MARQRFRTQFCFIAPAGLLDRYASHSHTHLVLPQVENSVYKEFYVRKRREGDLIILDNGAYELQDSVVSDFLLESIEYYRPHVVALPDFMMQGERTFEASRAFYREYRDRFPNTQWMYIPQSETGNVQGWYKWMNLALKEMDISWVGIPRVLATNIAIGPNAWLERANAVEQLTMRGYKTHALGMIGTAGNALRELELLFWEGCCSVDNSSPIWRGVHNLYIDREKDIEWWDIQGTPVNFNWSETTDNRANAFFDSIVKHNMNVVLKILNQPRIV